MEPMKRVDHMVFNVRDLDAALAFYTDVVGMKVTMKFDDRRMAFLSFGERFADIRLFEQGQQYEADRHWHGFNHVAFLPYGGRGELDALHERLKDEGVNVEGVETFAGDRHIGVYFRDPDNNRLEFYWEDPSWVAECRQKVARAFNGESADKGIDLYSWTTPNGIKAKIMLNLLGLKHRVIPVPLGPKAGEKPDGFAEASATNKLPAIVDHAAGVNMCESGAILLYLAEKTGSDLLPTRGGERAAVLQWLFAVSSTFNPAMTEGRFYFLMHKGEAPLAEDRVSGQIRRSYAAAEKALSEHTHLAGDTLSIADVALWPYVARHEWQGIDLNDYPAVKAWYQRLAAIPAFAEGWDMFGKGDTPPGI